MSKIKAIILAAGKGTRMNSDLAKVLHKVTGKEMVNHVLDSVEQAGIADSYLVVGHQADSVKQATAKRSNITYVLQAQQLGTGHAVMVVEPMLKDYEGNTVILCGDVPLLQAQTITTLLQQQASNDLDGIVLTVELSDPGHYGRVVRDDKGLVKKIVEYRDASDSERAIKEINSGIYAIRTKDLFEALGEIKADNDQKEYYLTDVVEIMIAKGKRFGSYVLADADQVHGVNDLNDLKKAEDVLVAKAV